MYKTFAEDVKCEISVKCPPTSSVAKKKQFHYFRISSRGLMAFPCLLKEFRFCSEEVDQIHFWQQFTFTSSASINKVWNLHIWLEFASIMNSSFPFFLNVSVLPRKRGGLALPNGNRGSMGSVIVNKFINFQLKLVLECVCRDSFPIPTFHLPIVTWHFMSC